MIGIAVELLISYLLLKHFSGVGLGALGLYPNKKNLKLMLAGFLIPSLFWCVLYLTLAYVGANPYRINPAYTLDDFLKTVGYVLRAVAFEELIFRGAILYLLIKRIGSKKAIIASAVAFGIYHWFSYGILGQIPQMIVIFAMTGAMGYLLADAFYKSKSILLPLALHLGNNFAGMIIFSRDKSIGLQLLVKSFTKDPATPGAAISIFLMVMYYTGVLLLIYCWLRRLKTGLALKPHTRGSSINKQVRSYVMNGFKF